FRSRLLHRSPDEVLLAADAPEVASAVGAPLVADLVLVMARTRVREGLVAVQRHAAGDGDVEAGVLVAGRVLEVDGHTADGVDEALEPSEVDFDEVLDRDAEVLLERRDEHVGTARERGVDALLAARARDVDPQVTREREDRGALGAG